MKNTMKYEVKCKLAEELVNDVLLFFERHSAEDLRYVPEIETGEITPYNELTNSFVSTIGGYIEDE